jgi:hypothetical protein
VVKFVIPSSCNCRLEWGGTGSPLLAACSKELWATDRGSIWGSSYSYRSIPDLGEFLQLSINQGMSIGLLLQPFFQELKPAMYLTNDDSAHLCCAPASSYRPRGWMGEFLLPAMDQGMSLWLLLQPFLHELKATTYVVRLPVYQEKKTWETEATWERVVPKKISTTGVS